MRFSKRFRTRMNIGTSSTDMTERWKHASPVWLADCHLKSPPELRKAHTVFNYFLLLWINEGEVTLRQTRMRNKFSVIKYMYGGKKWTNQLLNTWMPLQNNSWLYKNTLWMFKTQYQTQTCELYGEESAVYSYININTNSNEELSSHKWAQH